MRIIWQMLRGGGGGEGQGKGNLLWISNTETRDRRWPEEPLAWPNVYEELS